MKHMVMHMCVPGVRGEDIFKTREDFNQSGTVAISIELHTNKQALILQIMLKKTASNPY